MTVFDADGQAYVPKRRLSDRIATAARVVVRVSAAAASVVGARSRPIADHLRDHAYTIVGFGLIDSAMFVHSVFLGLIVTGASFLMFEWKVSDE